jgi:predicted PurR-regulated permease PerM
MGKWEAPLWYDRLGGIAWRAVIVVVATSMLVSGIVGLSAVILPLTLGLFFACGLRPITRRLNRRGLPPALSSLLAVGLVILAVVLVVWLTVHAVVDQWDGITALLAKGQATLVDATGDAGVDASTAASLGADISSLVADIASVAMRGVVHLVPTGAALVSTLLLSFFVAFFFLKDGAVMWRWILGRMGESAALTDRVGQRAWEAISGFIIGQTAIAAADASMITLGALILGVPNAGAIFMLTFIGAYIPFIGAFLSGMLAVLLALGDSGMRGGVIMLIIVLAVQVLEGNVLQPWIQGRAVRLHPLVIALSVTAGGALAGFLGVFLAVPVVAAGFVTLSELRQAGILGPGPLAAVGEADERQPAEAPAVES